jgi:enoyl-CoA hydratase
VICRTFEDTRRVLRGRPGASGPRETFIAGADINELAQLGRDGAADLSRRGGAVLSKLAHAPAVTIAAINGAALGGGCELALACDIRVMADGAKIGLPEPNLGVIPGWGGTQRLARTVGVGWAKEIILTGGMVEADVALRMGLINRTAPAEELLAAAQTVAGGVLKCGPTAVARAKQAVDRGLKGTLADGLAIETELFAECFDGDEAKEGLAAFIEKRSPNWQ